MSSSLYHHPDLLLSPSKGKAEPDVTRRKSDQMNGARKSQFPQTNQSNVLKRASFPINDQSGTGSSVDVSSAGGSWRYFYIVAG